MIVDRIKEDILSYLAESGADAGHVLAMRPFYHQRVMHYSPPEQDALTSALESLVADGFLEERNGSYFLTENGLSRIYPGGEAQAVTEVKHDILDFFKSGNARAGHALAVRPFFARYAMKYNPLHKRAIERAANELVREGTLEERDGGYFLTEVGYNRIYAA
jgi:hypothetical protein